MTEHTFTENVQRYCEIDAMIKELGKQRDALRDGIIAHMDENGMPKKQVNGYSLSLVVKHPTKVNDDLMLKVVKGWGDISKEIVRTKEYVDAERLEDMVYQGFVSPEQLKELDKCRTVSTVYSLTPRAVKKKDGE